MPDDSNLGSSSKLRKKRLKKARWLELGTIAYNLIEASVTITVGFLHGSSALVSFGLDATVEAVSASMLLWRISSEEKGRDEETLNRRKTWSFVTLGIVFLVLACFIVFDAVNKLLAQEESGFSITAVVILCISLVVNPFLAYFKHRSGKQIDSKALVMDSREQIICLYMTVVVLAGILLTKWQGWWWADPLAALLIVPYVLWQSWVAFQEAREASRELSQR